MDMSTIWWLFAGTFVIAELLTGTFYLLMLGLGFAGGALAAHAGLGVGWQYLITSLTGELLVILCYLKQSKQSSGKNAQQTNPAIHLDIGSVVDVDEWSSLGTANVQYRGANWAARHVSIKNTHGLSHEGLDSFKIGSYRIKAVEGNTLILESVSA
jgi:membrane protein implicated in regulation of membrane protease activity